MREVFDLLFRIQQRTGINLLIIGGWALQAHGYARNTVDVDCMTSTANDAAVGQELERVGFECFHEQSAFRRFRHRINPFLVLDVMRVNESTFEKIWPAAQPFQMAGLELKVPSLPHLIALKLHAAKNEHRSLKDIGDIRELLTINPHALKPTELQALCDRFGTPALAQHLKEWL